LARRRLDSELVRRGLVTSRREAQELVSEGRVLVDGTLADKAARLVAPSEALRLTGGPRRFVSRGGAKLEAALDRFTVDVSGRTCLDAGASTGGFTDCLLQRGAAAVVAVDVGHGQLDPRLRADHRVTVLERTNVRQLQGALAAVAVPAAGGGDDGDGASAAANRPAGWAGRFTVVVADLSFISLAVAVPVLCGDLAAPGADVILLVKPQFEVGRRPPTGGGGWCATPACAARPSDGSPPPARRRERASWGRWRPPCSDPPAMPSSWCTAGHTPRLSTLR
jgi:23S rRNA (cytidine1920-2'-O)/16S rRNA (cytidine1409-2'-O)-methyltransferase